MIDTTKLDSLIFALSDLADATAAELPTLEDEQDRLYEAAGVAENDPSVSFEELNAMLGTANAAQARFEWTGEQVRMVREAISLLEDAGNLNRKLDRTRA